MSQAMRGGRAILDRLLAEIHVIDGLAEEAREAVLRNPRLAQHCDEDIRTVVRDLRRLISEELEPMLRRRDKATEDDLRTHLLALEKRIEAIEQRPGAPSDRAPIPIRKATEGR